MYPIRFGLGYVTQVTQEARARQLAHEHGEAKAPELTRGEAYRIIDRRMGFVGLTLAILILGLFAVAGLAAA